MAIIVNPKAAQAVQIMHLSMYWLDSPCGGGQQ